MTSSTAMLGFEVLAIALASQRRSASLTRALGLAVWFLACAAARRLTAVPFSLGDHACITLLALASWLPAEPRLRATPRARFWIGAGLAQKNSRLSFESRRHYANARTVMFREC